MITYILLGILLLFAFFFGILCTVTFAVNLLNLWIKGE